MKVCITVVDSCFQGLYIYNNINHLDQHELRYHGIPKQLKYNGIRRNKEFCHIGDDSDKGCEPLKKTFYLQYQWFPFYMGAIALLYYLPYVVFKFVNGDIIQLKKKVKESEPNVPQICSNYFNHQVMGIPQLLLSSEGKFDDELVTCSSVQ